MAIKIKTLKLSYPHLNPKAEVGDKDANGFRVETITDSVEYTPGQFLTTSEVNELCSARDWKVVSYKSTAA